MFELYKYNIKDITDNNKPTLKFYSTDDCKEKWIKEVLENNNLICLECVESGYLIGFVFLVLNEDENYIMEFHIINSYQHDGRTFRYIANGIVNASQPGKEFTGRIWSENYSAQKIFKSMGALLKDGKYRLSYNKVKEWLEKDVSI